MTTADEKYITLLKDILENGVDKDTRSGKVKSVFQRQLRFNLKEGIPLLTTKKVYTKGIIHELLWFLSGDTNIAYLVRNNVHIWDDDAYRFYKETLDRFKKELDENKFTLTIENDSFNDSSFLRELSKEEFINMSLDGIILNIDNGLHVYKFGDLGEVYGKNWRRYGSSEIDQISNLITKLKENPNDRRLLIDGYNPCTVNDAALPPCHLLYQFYTRELTKDERMKIFNERYMLGMIPSEYFDMMHDRSKNNDDGVDLNVEDGDYDVAQIPKYELSCMQYCRSQDYFLGTCFNWASASILVHMIAMVCNMTVGEYIWNGGDVHVYLNQMDAVNEILSRNGSEKTPQLKIKRIVNNIDDFKYEDFEIVNYEPNPPIKAKLNVG